MSFGDELLPTYHTFIWSLASMIPHMNIQSRLLAERLTAQLTTVRLLICMNSPMYSQVSTFSEAPITKFALEWLYTSVCSQMSNKIGRDSLATNVAHDASGSVVRFAMSRVRSESRIDFGTSLTRIRFPFEIRIVASHMIFEVALIFEHLPACFTSKSQTFVFNFLMTFDC